MSLVVISIFFNGLLFLFVGWIDSRKQRGVIPILILDLFQTPPDG